MGFLKSMVDLQRQAGEISKTFDPAAQMAQAQQQMAQAQAMMAQQTAAATIALSGLDGVATITGVRQTGAMINFQPVLDVDLSVVAADRAPHATTVSGPVEQLYLSRAQPGSEVAVKVDQANPDLVWINWAMPVA